MRFFGVVDGGVTRFAECLEPRVVGGGDWW